MGAKPKYISADEYVSLYAHSIDIVRKDAGTALLLAFDIDDTLLLTDGVLQALESIEGAGNNMFVVAATGRTLEDVQASFEDFKIPLVARDGSWLRYWGQRVRKLQCPTLEDCRTLASAHISEAASKGLEICRGPSSLDIGPLKKGYDDIKLWCAPRQEEMEALSKFLLKFLELAERRCSLQDIDIRYREKGFKDSSWRFEDWQVEVLLSLGPVNRNSGTISMMRFLSEEYKIENMILFAHGNRSEDEKMTRLASNMRYYYEMRLARKMPDSNRLNMDRLNLGGGFWVGEQSDLANFSIEDVNMLQQGVTGLARHVKRVDWYFRKFVSSNPACHCCYLFLNFDYEFFAAFPVCLFEFELPSINRALGLPIGTQVLYNSLLIFQAMIL
jgi:hypothetical protein